VFPSLLEREVGRDFQRAKVLRIMRVSVLLLSILLLTASLAHARGYEAQKTVGGYEVVIRIDKNPPILGDNQIEVEIKDGSGKVVKDAEVLINYYMPPMPRMVPMNYKVDAKLKGDSYRAKMVLIMSGPWAIVTKISHRGKRHSVKVSIDVP
jgi:hypothetical protein